MNAWEKLDKAVKEWKSGRTKGTPSSAPTPDIAQQIDNSLTNAFTEGYHRGRQSVYDDAAAIEEARK